LKYEIEKVAVEQLSFDHFDFTLPIITSTPPIRLHGVVLNYLSTGTTLLDPPHSYNIRRCAIDPLEAAVSTHPHPFHIESTRKKLSPSLHYCPLLFPHFPFVLIVF
jgi:hypothetical protein